MPCDYIRARARPDVWAPADGDRRRGRAWPGLSATDAGDGGSRASGEAGRGSQRSTSASNARGFKSGNYGLTTWRDLFTPRQLVALTTFSDLVQEARERVKRDALAAGLPDDGKPLAAGGTGAPAYADAVGVYLAFAVDKAADGNTTLCDWSSSRKAHAAIR